MSFQKETRMLTPSEAYVRGGMDPALEDEEALDNEVQWLASHGQFEQAVQMIRGWVSHRTGEV